MAIKTIGKIVHFKCHFLILVIFLSIAPISSCIRLQSYHPETTHQIEDSQDNYKLDWVRGNIFIRDDKSPLLVAGGRKLAFIGSNAESPYEKLFIVDNSSEVEISEDCILSIGMDDKFVYVGNCIGGLSSYDLSGKRKWYQSINGTTEGKIIQILPSEDSLFIYTEVGHIFHLSRTDGDIQEEYQPGCSNAVVGQDVIYDLCNNGLEATSIESKVRLWMHYLEEPSYGYPLIIGNYLILRTGSETGNIFVFDRMNGSVLWYTTAGNIIGNLVEYHGLLYSLTTSGQLQGYAINNGQLQTTLTFTPSITINPAGSPVNAVYLASDTEKIYVYLGDSLQLFSLHIPK